MTQDDDSLSARVLSSVGRYSAENPKKIMVLTLLLTGLAGGVAATTLQMEMGLVNLVDEDSDYRKDWNELQTEFGEGNHVVVFVESEGDVRSPETIKAVDRLDQKYSDIEQINHVTSVADFVRAGSGGTIPDSQQKIEQILEGVKSTNSDVEELYKNVVPNDNETVLVLTYGEVDIPNGSAKLMGLLPLRPSELVMDKVRKTTEDASLPADLSVTFSGRPPFENAVFSLLLPELIKLLSAAFALIGVIVVIVMRGQLVRSWAALLPVVTAVHAMTIMNGAMGALGYNFNAPMLGLMPIALGLGVDYGLQIQSRYLEERRNGHPPEDAAAIAAGTTGRVLVIVVGTTVLGFGSLVLSRSPPIQAFGVVSSINVAVAMGLAVTFLISLLVTNDAVETSGESTAESDTSSGSPAAGGGAASAGATSSARTLLADGSGSDPSDELDPDISIDFSSSDGLDDDSGVDWQEVPDEEADVEAVFGEFDESTPEEVIATDDEDEEDDSVGAFEFMGDDSSEKASATDADSDQEQVESDVENLFGDLSTVVVDDDTSEREAKRDEPISASRDQEQVESDVENLFGDISMPEPDDEPAEPEEGTPDIDIDIEFGSVEETGISEDSTADEASAQVSDVLDDSGSESAGDPFELVDEEETLPEESTEASHAEASTSSQSSTTQSSSSSPSTDTEDTTATSDTGSASTSSPEAESGQTADASTSTPSPDSPEVEEAASSVEESAVTEPSVGVDEPEKPDPEPGAATSSSAPETHGRLEAAFGRISNLIAARPLVVLLILTATMAGGAAAYTQVEPSYDGLAQWPAIEEKRALESTLQKLSSPRVMYAIVETDGAYSPSSFENIDQFQQRLRDNPNVGAVVSPVTAVNLASDKIPDSSQQIRTILDRQRENPLFSYSSPEEHPDKLLVTIYAKDVRRRAVGDFKESIEATAAKTMPGAEVSVTGDAILNYAAKLSMSTDLNLTILSSFTLGFLFLLLMFRSVREALLLILVPLCAALLLAGVMYASGAQWFPISFTTAAIVLGVGIDYGLHVHERFREELESGAETPAEAMNTAMSRLSRPILGSGLTTILAFGTLILSQFPIVSNFGVALVLAFTAALVATFTILPAATLMLYRTGLGTTPVPDTATN